MKIQSIVKKFIYKTVRLRHHFRAMATYPSLKKVVTIFRNEIERIAGKTQVKSYPYVVLIDPSGVCNLHCPTCPTGSRVRV